MNQLLLVLITALVTGVVSISGIWFGSRLTRVAEDRKWRRDRVVEAYAEFLRVRPETSSGITKFSKHEAD